MDFVSSVDAIRFPVLRMSLPPLDEHDARLLHLIRNDGTLELPMVRNRCGGGHTLCWNAHRWLAAVGLRLSAVPDGEDTRDRSAGLADLVDILQFMRVESESKIGKSRARIGEERVEFLWRFGAQGDNIHTDYRATMTDRSGSL